MDGTPTIWSDGHIVAPRRPLHICLKFFLYTLALWWVMGLESVFEKICGGRTNLCVYNFQVFSESPLLKTVLSQLSWVITLLCLGCCNLANVEIEDLERLMSLLSNIHLTPFVLDAKTWVLSSSGVFSVKSFFSTLSFSSNSILFYLANFLWKSRVLSKVRTFAWLVALKKVNTNDMLQLRRPFKVLSPH